MRPHEGLADDRHDRLVVELGVIEPVEQVDGARARGGHADADLPGELGVPARHECGHLLVARLYEPQPVLVPSESAEDPVDAVAWEPVDAADPPFLETLHQVVADGIRHCVLHSAGYGSRISATD